MGTSASWPRIFPASASHLIPNSTPQTWRNSWQRSLPECEQRLAKTLGWLLPVVLQEVWATSLATLHARLYGKLKPRSLIGFVMRGKSRLSMAPVVVGFEGASIVVRVYASLTSQQTRKA